MLINGMQRLEYQPTFSLCQKTLLPKLWSSSGQHCWLITEYVANQKPQDTCHAILIRHFVGLPDACLPERHSAFFIQPRPNTNVASRHSDGCAKLATTRPVHRTQRSNVLRHRRLGPEVSQLPQHHITTADQPSISSINHTNRVHASPSTHLQPPTAHNPSNTQPNNHNLRRAESSPPT